MYKLLNDNITGNLANIILKPSENKSIPFDPDNTDYQEYLAWVAEGNEPEAAD